MPNHVPEFDVIIAGAGIVGLATAWQLSRIQPELRIAVMEKEPRAARHQSSRNSGVIHSGVYYEPGSAKAVNCIRGYHQMVEFAEAFGIPHRICGKVIAAVDETERPMLAEIFRRGNANGLEGLEMLDEKASREAEPHVRAVESIWVPQAGIIDYGVVCLEIVTQLQARSVSFYFDHEFTGFRQEVNHTVISTRHGDFHTGLFINCCGLYADRVALITGMTGSFRIIPFRGEFYKLTGLSAGLVKHLVYPVPDPRFPFLGVHFTLRIDGGVEAGPNAVMAFAREGYSRTTVNASELSEILTFTGFHKMAMRYWKKGWEEMYRSFSRKSFLKSMRHLIPEVRDEDIAPNRSGVRAQCVGSDGKMIYDYLILEKPMVINVVNAPSPAATSAFAIGEHLSSRALAALNPNS